MRLKKIFKRGYNLIVTLGRKFANVNTTKSEMPHKTR